MSRQDELLQTHGRNSWLDVLRGLAILGVVAVHSLQVTDKIVVQNKSDQFSAFISLGRYGVELFFFLSGWLLISIYGKNRNSLGRAYWVRRIARIYPLWILFLLVTLLRWEFTSSGQSNLRAMQIEGQPNFFYSISGIILLTLTFTLFLSPVLWNGVIPGGWSIQAEVAHYLFFPLIRSGSFNSVLKIATVFNIFTALMIFTRPMLTMLPQIVLSIVDAWFRLSLYSTIGFFLIGILSYTVFCNTREFQISKLKISDLNFSFNVFIVYLVSLLLVPLPFGTSIEAFGYVLVMIFVSLGILRTKKIGYLFQFLGKHAYFVYFMHFLVLAFVNRIVNELDLTVSWLGGQQVIFICVLALTIIISLFTAIPSMKFFERPFIRLAHKLK